MECLRLNSQKPFSEEVENWDDDDLILDGEELSFRNSLTTASTSAAATTTATAGGDDPQATNPIPRRDSSSSRLSLFSDRDSWHGEEKQLQLPADDESTMDALAAAEHAGIPLPKNVPSSALMGGTIKRLGGRKIRKIIQEDWENDMEIPDTSQDLIIKPKYESDFPETLRQVSAGSAFTSPREQVSSTLIQTDHGNAARTQTSVLSSALNLDRFKDEEQGDHAGNVFADGGDTIKAPKTRMLPKPMPFITPPTPQKPESSKDTEDDFERDLELPSHGTLKLTTKRNIPKTPSSQADDSEWGEGSLGTRYGGTRRDGRSNRSSSASALSPSVSSSITAESEDETFDGLVLPAGPVNFKERLQHRKESASPERIPEEPESSPKKVASTDADQADFFEGIDIGDGTVFDSGTLSLHRNIKIKESQPASPVRPKAAVSLTFTHRPSGQARLPQAGHERANSTSLEPVFEGGGPNPHPRSRKSQPRLGHSTQSSVVSLPTPTTISPGRSIPPSSPHRRDASVGPSSLPPRNEPPTRSAQLLKQQRSLPAVRVLNTPVKTSASRSDRPLSRTENGLPPSILRPKTPVERQRPGALESPAPQPRKTHVLPFVPAGASQLQSQHISSKSLRHIRRQGSDHAIDMRTVSRSVSRSAMRSPSPHRLKVATDTWERLSKPKNRRHFGDGHELDGFDDLPTSRELETRFLKQPVSSVSKIAARNKMHISTVLPDRVSTPAPSTFSPGKVTQTPHFARDTAASRIARETSLAQRAPSGGALSTMPAARETQVLANRGHNVGQPQVPQHMIRPRRRLRRAQQLKPHLISNLNSGKESKVVNGMFYNAETYRWEGNENALRAFDNAPVSTPSTTSASLHMVRDREVSTPRPALITNFSATKGVQVVGGMVFDPQSMCWLKLEPQGMASMSDSNGGLLYGADALEDDEDVFKDIPDLEDNSATEDRGGGNGSDLKDDWLVGEEFDVGPEFVRRQREEEERWRRKCEKWVGRGLRDHQVWRWTIRDLVSQFDDLPM